MPSQETQILDNIIASRRALLLGGGAALAALAMPSIAHAASTVTTYSDTDILNFALNLEYLEANFYYLAAFGTNISTANTLYPTGAMVQGITGIGTQGTVTVKATPQGPLHQPRRRLLRGRNRHRRGQARRLPPLRARHPRGGPAADRPHDLLQHARLRPPASDAAFDPFASDANFLIGAYIFEDVGVTAYHGAAPLITTTTTGKTYLAAAAGILAVEAYHAGLVRTTINALDNGIVFPTVPTGTLTSYTNLHLRASAPSSLSRPAPTAPNPDDYGLSPPTIRLARRRRHRYPQPDRRCRPDQRHRLLPQHHPGPQHRHRRKCNHFRHKSHGRLLPQRSQRPLLVADLLAQLPYYPGSSRCSARAFSDCAGSLAISVNGYFCKRSTFAQTSGMLSWESFAFIFGCNRMALFRRSKFSRQMITIRIRCILVLVDLDPESACN